MQTMFTFIGVAVVLAVLAVIVHFGYKKVLELKQKLQSAAATTSTPTTTVPPTNTDTATAAAPASTTTPNVADLQAQLTAAQTAKTQAEADKAAAEAARAQAEHDRDTARAEATQLRTNGSISVSDALKRASREQIADEVERRRKAVKAGAASKKTADTLGI